MLLFFLCLFLVYFLLTNQENCNMHGLCCKLTSSALKGTVHIKKNLGCSLPVKHIVKFFKIRDKLLNTERSGFF